EWTKAKSPDKGIEKRLNRAGIGYFSLVELGNVFLGLDDWKERYCQLIDHAGDLLVARLRDVAQPYCIMCSEKRPEDCHRSLIADFLARTQGATVEHLVDFK